MSDTPPSNDEILKSIEKTLTSGNEAQRELEALIKKNAEEQAALDKLIKETRDHLAQVNQQLAEQDEKAAKNLARLRELSKTEGLLKREELDVIMAAHSQAITNAFPEEA